MENIQDKETAADIMELPLITIEQAAILFQVSSRTIRNKLGKGEIPYIKIGTIIRIKREEFLTPKRNTNKSQEEQTP